MNKQHVAVLYGGLSKEREVSLESGRAIEESLKRLGHKITMIDVDEDIYTKLKKLNPDVVFNALHGTYGEDGCIQGILEFLSIPYTHSGVLASSVAMNKPIAKQIFAQNGILCPEGNVYSKEQILKSHVIEPPYVIKPVSDGSSVGVLIISSQDETINEKLLNEDHFLVEKYIPGKEVSVAVTDDGPLGAIEVVPKEGFYDYKNKYVDGKTEHIMPAPLNEAVYGEILAIAQKAHHLIGCKGVSRSDFRYDEDGDGLLYLLEINTQPGMTKLSLVPEIANYKGIHFDSLVKYLLKRASCENKKPKSK